MLGTSAAVVGVDRRQSKFQWFSRLGYASRGVIYLIIGWLAVSFALGNGGQTADSEQALHIIAYQRFGDLMLSVVAVGFVAFAVWRAGSGRGGPGLLRSAGAVPGHGCADLRVRPVGRPRPGRSAVCHHAFDAA